MAMLERQQEFLDIVRANPGVAAVVERMRTFGAPDLWLVSGCLFQSVWNVLERKPPEHGILDYDLFYYDPDTSYEAEDVWIKRAATHFAATGLKVELRNQARVHLWYREKFGVDYPPLTSSCDGVDHFLFPACMVAVRPIADGKLELYAPLGLDDVFNRTLRSNPLWPTPRDERFWSKVRRYQSAWPSVTVAD
ncbi:MAG: hypothetical protein GC190_10990 [Alphaproteobacteria bacterium]|nr:hypothetical protein [Alphaproteobacteria bacterium]